MTLQQWTECSHISAQSYHSGFIVTIDPICLYYRELWRLDDYQVNEVSRDTGLVKVRLTSRKGVSRAYSNERKIR